MTRPAISSVLERTFDSYCRLQRTGDYLAHAQGRPEQCYLKEIHTTALFLICCVFAKNGELEEAEASFLNQWLSREATPQENARQVNAHLAAWRRVVPNFFAGAIEHDLRTREGIAGQMLDHMYGIISTTAAVCGNSPLFQLGEALNYFTFLRHHLLSQGLSLRDAESASAARWKEDARQLQAAYDGQEHYETLLQQLNGLLGLERVKQEVHTLANLIRVQALREQHGMVVPPMSHHLVFSGNPGTGKTTVARLLAKIYRSLGVLKKGHLVETDRSGLVAGYMGQTALKVKDVVERALGGALFIDEAYSLAAGKDTEDYGHEAIDALLKEMEDHRDDFIVIVAGYPAKMQEFLDSNPGLRSRFSKFIHFDDYPPQALYDIFLKFSMESGYTFDEPFGRATAEQLKRMHERRAVNFGNARSVRHLFEQAVARHANRVARLAQPSPEDLRTFQLGDLPD